MPQLLRVMEDLASTVDSAASDDLTALELADGLLENVFKCPDCAKPVLESALDDHAGARPSQGPR